MEAIAYTASDKVDQTDLENVYEFLRGYTDIFAKNVISTEDITKIEGKNGKYKETNDITMYDLEQFQDFLCQNFKKYEHYNEMFFESNETAKIYGMTKSHKFDSTDNI